MKEIKCIYCGKGRADGVEISESDIIPDGLTNAKIRCKNVCKTEHNNRFSDLFESKIINELAFLRNHLNIKGKAGKFPVYEARVKIDNEVYKTKTVNDATLVGSKKIINTTRTALLGPIEEIEKMKNSGREIRVIDLKSTPIEKQVDINQEVFICNEMYRLVSKIAYEWFCKQNNIVDKYPCFDRIIDFITLGQCDNESDIVSVVSDSNIYNQIHNQCVNGSHFLCAYVLNNDRVNVIVSLFGLAIYKVNLCKSSNFDKKVFCEEFMLTGDKKAINASDIKTLETDLNNCYQIDFNGIKLCIPKQSNNNIFINDKIFFINFLSYITNKSISFNDIQCFNEILKSNYKDLLSSTIIDVNVMKRFINDYNICSDFKITTNNSNKEFWFKVRVLFEIGFNNINNIDNKLLNSIAKKLIPTSGNECIITDEVIDEFKKYILRKENYIEYIVKGAKNILST